jgi:uncharacterized protein (TIGR00299 family) protein
VVTSRVLWIDASAGVAGDMLLGALVDLGIPLRTLQDAVDAVLPGQTRLVSTVVTRAGLRATKVDVEALPAGGRSDRAGQPRTWTTIRGLVTTARLAPGVRDQALRTFERLAEAEGRVHGVSPEQVHFHEVGAVDAIADIVGTSAGLAALAADRIVLSPVALGTGEVRSDHGWLPVPVPAVLELARGWQVTPGGTSGAAVGELATPTGAALVTTAAAESGPLPPMRLAASGVGAGSRDHADRANVVRLVLGSTEPAEPAEPDAVLLETNVDDLDPRVWPAVLDTLLANGALDAWLTPVLAKKGRPAHTLHVLVRPEDEGGLGDLVLAHTSTLGMRMIPVRRNVLDRAWTPVEVLGTAVRIKLGLRAGRLVQVMPEFDDVAALAGSCGMPVADVLVLARSAAVTAGLVAGAAWPPDQP